MSRSRLTPSDLQQFREKGFFFPVDALSPDETRTLIPKVEAHLAWSTVKGGGFATLAQGPKSHLLWRWADELIRHPRLLDIAESVIGPDLLVWGTGIFTKYPEDPADLAWHQDSLTYGLTGSESDLVRVWIALTACSLENGTLRFAEASHQDGLFAHARGTKLSEWLRGDEVAADMGSFQQHDVILDPGQCSLHTMLTVHCSGINSTSAPRVNFAIDYVAPSARPVGEGPDSALLVRGQDRYHHFIHESPPTGDAGEDEIMEFRRAVDRRMHRLEKRSLENVRTGLLLQR